MHDINWQDFEQILEELGEKRASRIAYWNGTLEVRMPLPEHEVDKELISNMVKALLDWMGREYECFGSTTFRNENMNSGIEPDNCFYIQTKGIIKAGKLDIVLPNDIDNGEVDVIVVSKEAPDEFENRHHAMLQQGYDTPEKVLDLIHQIKLEMLKEKGRA